MEISKGMFLKKDEQVLKVLAVEGEKVLVIDCIKRGMPRWISASVLPESKYVTCFNCVTCVNGVIKENELPVTDRAKARYRYTLIAGILPYIADDSMRNEMIKRMCSQTGLSRRTLTQYLCDYLVYEDIGALVTHSPKADKKEKELTADQKNMRWALNKFYYTRHGNTLPDTYVMMLKERYTDENGKLFDSYPTIHQFRYYFRTHRSIRTEIISRKGLKEYQLNYRPLLGDGVQELADTVGYGMLDGTICDIYLVDDAGNLIGRPVLVACVDAYSGLCCGYALLLEGGVYSIRSLLLNVITDKVEWCSRFGICITDEQWPCHQLPGVFITDRGSEYISYNFEQVTELGCRVISLPSFSANMKGPVEKLFDLVQDSFKPFLKGKGVIEPDYRKRGMHDYRKDACLTMTEFEKIVIHCIIYHNSKRVIENFSYTDGMIQDGVKPHASSIWIYGKEQPGANLLSVDREQLVMTLLPRTEGRFTRYGLKVNGLRYHCEGYTEKYLAGGTAIAAYNPDDASAVYLVDDGFKEFRLIEKKYKGRTLDEVNGIKAEQKKYVKSYAQEQLQAKIELANHIETIAGQKTKEKDTGVRDIRKSRQRAKNGAHKDIVKEMKQNG